MWRDSDHGVEIVIVHRPRRRDWTLPKGKLDAGELTLTAACREVWEETGMRVAPQNHLARVRYPMPTNGGSVEKIVDYWVMRFVSQGKFIPNDEIDDLRWMPVDRARDLLIYPRDIELVKLFATQPRITGVVVLLPTNESSKREAESTATLLALFEPERITQLAPRGRQLALEYLATLRGLLVETRALKDGKPKEALSVIRDHATEYPASVVSADQDLAQRVKKKLAERDGIAQQPPATEDATLWILGFTGRNLSAMDAFRSNGAPW
ncbi:MAG: NUDIX hydrolase [Longispora sp.]|nr:NUDIX hydrolase [Longispora sp. (in: high G+C Gram-positive bacteria)]